MRFPENFVAVSGCAIVLLPHKFVNALASQNKYFCKAPTTVTDNSMTVAFYCTTVPVNCTTVSGNHTKMAGKPITIRGNSTMNIHPARKSRSRQLANVTTADVI